MYKEDLHFITNPNNIFSIQVYIPLGSIHEKKGQFGISHFLEHMKFRRSKRHSLNKMLQLFNNVPSFNAYTTKDHTSYYIRSNNGNGKGTYNDVVDLMYELVFNTSFTKNEIQTDRKSVV